MKFDQHKTQIKNLANKHKLEFVALFGSEARGNTHKESDIDIAVLSKEKIEILDITSDFCDLFKRDDVEVVDVGNASPTICVVVVRDGVLLYEKDDGYFAKWKMFAIKVWMESAWLRDLQKKTLLNWLEKQKT
jgi:predicted nucleotidyltransferase